MTTMQPSSSFQWRRPRVVVAALALGYVVIAYGVMPAVWRSYERRHPAFEHIPNRTYTGAGIPGDPINVALVGSEDDVVRIMKAAGWVLAARLGVRSDFGIAAGTVFDRPDPTAPVSNLYLLGRREDLTFEQEVGASPRQRHHVRFWRTGQTGAGRPTWVGAAVYDRGITFSHTTGQITHAIAPALDDERDYLFDSLEKTGGLGEWYAVDGYQAVKEGRNGDGNPWRTDGRLFVGVIDRSVAATPPPAK